MKRYFVKRKCSFVLLFMALLLTLYFVYLLHDYIVQSETRHKMYRFRRKIASSEKAIKKPEKATFDSHLPKVAILLSYQGSGSSFTGQLFNQNSEMMYLFEPVDSIYHAMYGTQQGYAVPSDIFYFWNGTRRKIPNFEEKIIADSLETFFKCDLDNVPHEMLNHKFMDTDDSFFSLSTKSLEPFITCLKSKPKCNCDPQKQRCAKALKHTCPISFGENHFRHKKCFQALWLNLADIKYFDNPEVDTFFEYNQCIQRINSTMQRHCVPKIKELCSRAKVRTAKTVRLSMQTAETLIRRMKNLRIIQLIRDPRGVVLSRRRGSSFHGHFSGEDMSKEAQLYCQHVLEDEKHRQLIEQHYPGTTMQVIYEEFSINPMKYAKDIYSFLGEKLPSSVEGWLFNNTKGIIKNSATIAAKWQNKLSYILSKNISEACSSFYKEIKYNWP